MQGRHWPDASRSDKCRYIVVCIKDVLLHMNLRIQDARGQCYDGCSTMTGTKYGVEVQVKKLNERCLLMHCYCHSLLLSGIQ